MPASAEYISTGEGKMGEKVYIVIPAYNEQSAITGVLSDLKSHGYQNIVVVDDYSTDSTAAISRQNSAAVVRHSVNRGQGASLQTGIDYALAHGADIIVTFDADGQHSAAEIPDLLKPIRDREVEVALGSRFLSRKSNVPLFKQLALKAGIIFTYFRSVILLSDAHNGFRALSRSAAQKIRITSDRMEHASEIVEEIHKKHLKHKEVPVTVHYTEYSRGKGQSPFEALRIGARTLFRKLIS